MHVYVCVCVCEGWEKKMDSSLHCNLALDDSRAIIKCESRNL